VQQLQSRGFKHAYIDGGITIQRFLAVGLIDRLVITRVPVLKSASRYLAPCCATSALAMLQRAAIAVAWCRVNTRLLQGNRPSRGIPGPYGFNGIFDSSVCNSLFWDTQSSGKAGDQ
jgi:hypothetical protein